MRHVDLCSGIGGFALGFEWAGLSKPVLFCDIEPWSRKVLRKHWPDVPIAEDVKELANDPERLVPDCEIITAGYPCQPFSQAGKRKGEQDPRHIWPELIQIVARKRPSWCVFENVYGHVSMGLDKVLTDLETEDYAARPFIVPAVSVGAPHRRDRVFIVAKNVGDSGGGGRSGFDGRWTGQESADGCSHVAYTDDERPQGWLSRRERAGWQSELGYAGRGGSIHGQSEQNQWAVEPDVGRVAHGVSKRVDRIRGLGNAIVPQIAKQIGIAIKETENYG